MQRSDSERALCRLEQLAREERAAVLNGDVDAICRISELLPDATSSALAADHVRTTPFTERIEAILESHRAAESFLAARLTETRTALRQIGGGQRAMNGYGRSAQLAGRVQSQG
jgi:hypothetical protein